MLFLHTDCYEWMEWLFCQRPQLGYVIWDYIDFLNYNPISVEICRKLFKDLLDFTFVEIESVSVHSLFSKFNEHFRDENGEISEAMENHLKKINDFTKSREVLDHFVRHNFIGYINYSLIKVFQKVANSPLLNMRIEKFEKKEYNFFLALNLRKASAFNLSPECPVGIPTFKVQFQSEIGERRSIISLRECFQQCHLNPHHIDQLMLAKIEKNGVCVTFAVLPHIAKRVVKCLTSDDVASILKSNGVSVDISPELYQYQAKLPSKPDVFDVKPSEETLSVKPHWHKDSGIDNQTGLYLTSCN